MSQHNKSSLPIGTVVDVSIEEQMPTGYWLKLNNKANDNAVFLPIENAVDNFATQQPAKVFITVDADNSIIADSRLPRSEIGKACLLTAKDATDRGAFFDWGTSRDLYVPKKWQESPINPGMDYLVVPIVDEKHQRIVGCTKLKHCFPESNKWFTVKQKVSLQVFAKTQLGYKMLIEGNTLGLLFHSDVHVKLNIGDCVEGSIKQIREDGKIDLTIAQQSQATRDNLQQSILDDLAAHGGITTLTDKSSPEEIYEHFQVSKGAYKKAIGSLYRAKLITIGKDVIRLVDNN